MDSNQPLSLVTGACGVIGSHLVEVLAEAGHRVRATDQAEAFAGAGMGASVRDDPRRGLFPAAVAAAGAEIVASDLRDPATLGPALEGVDFVFHAHASSAVDSSARRAFDVEGTRALVDLLLQEPRRSRLRRFVLCGEGGVHGLPGPRALPITEETPAAPPNEELRSRWEQDQLVAEAGRTRGLPFSTIRPAGLYGPRAASGGGLGRDLLAPARARVRAKVVAVPSSFTARVPFVHVRDVARAALHVALDERARGEAYIVCDDSLMSLVDLAKIVAEARGARFVLLPPVPVELVKPLALAAARASTRLAQRLPRWPLALAPETARAFGHDLVYSNRKLKGLGFELLYPDAREGIEETIAWYADQGWLDGKGGQIIHGH